MKKITYKEFEEIMKELKCEVHWRDDHISIKPNTRDIITLATVNRNHVKVLDLDWGVFDDILTTKGRIALADACWQLASTPLKDREAPKRYYLRIVESYMSFFDERYPYLNMSKQTRKIFIDSKNETHFWKTIFTEEEINELAKECDLSLFEKVEVEDE